MDNTENKETSLPVTSEPPSISREVEQAFSGARRPIPVSTIDWQSTQNSQVIPLRGIDFLRNINNLIIQQTVELNDLISRMASENRYLVKVPQGETLYYSIEISQDCQRNCFGSNRAFIIKFYDPTQQEALQLRRRFACGACCSVFCYLQEMEVWIPPGRLLGTIKQCFSLTNPYFTILNQQGDNLFKIQGPNSMFGCFLGQKPNFQIYDGNGEMQIGSVVHQWNAEQGEYNLSLEMQINSRNSEHKALLLGATFLLEYMYFESSKRSCCGCL